MSASKCPECEFTGEDENLKLHLHNKHYRDQIKAKYEEGNLDLVINQILCGSEP